MLSESPPCFAGIDGNSSVEVSLPWLWGMISSGAGFDGSGGGFASPCCISCAATRATVPIVIASANNMTVSAEIDLRVISGILIIAMYALRCGSTRSHYHDPICCCIGQAAHFFPGQSRSGPLSLFDEFAVAKFHARNHAGRFIAHLS